MAHNKALLSTAAVLRKKGLSIGEIAARISIPKATVSYWCKDIPLSSEMILSISRRRRSKTTLALLQYSERQRTERKFREEQARKDASRKVGTLEKRDIFMLGLGLYWGEGYKTSNGECGFSNSDPAMLIAYIHFLATVFGISKKDLIARISINESHQPRAAAVRTYWIKQLDLQPQQFTKTSFIHSASKKTFPNPEKHFGVLRLKVRNGKKYKDYILGALNAVTQNLKDSSTKKPGQTFQF